MRTVELTGQAITAAGEAILEDGPVSMVNLLRFREHADYGDRADLAPCSGQEAYMERYRPAFGAIAAGAGVEPICVGGVIAGLVTRPGERWDVVAIVRYPTFAAFRRIVENPAYQAEAAPHRMAALEDARLIATAHMPLPG